MLANLDPGDGRGYLAEGTAVGMTGLEVEGVHLRRAAVHPKENARAATFGARSGAGRQGLQPARHRAARDTRGRQTQPIPPRQLERRTSHGISSIKSND